MAQDAAQHVHHDAFRDFSFATRHRPQRLHYLPFNQLLTRSATDNYQAWLEHLYPFAPGEDYPFPEGQTQEEQILTFKRLKDQVLRWGASDQNFKKPRVQQWVQETWARLKKAAEDGSDLMLLEVIGTYPTPPAPDWGVQETALDINTKTINHRAESDIARRALLYKLFMNPPYTLQGGGPPKLIEPLVMPLVEAWESHLNLNPPKVLTIDDRIHQVLIGLTAMGPIVPDYIFNGTASDKLSYLCKRAEKVGLLCSVTTQLPTTTDESDKIPIITGNQEQALVLCPTSQTLSCLGQSTSQATLFKIAYALSDGKRKTKAQLKDAIWVEKDAPHEWERELRDRISDLRRWLNSIVKDLGKNAIPPALNGSYMLNLAILPVKNPT